MTGRDGVILRPISLPDAMSEPVKVIEPMTTSSDGRDVDSVRPGTTFALANFRYSSMAMSAAAPPPTALNSDTSCGIAVIFTVRAVYRPKPPPSAMPATITSQPTALKPAGPRRVGAADSGLSSSSTAVAPIASAMPPADSRLPLRAVAGEFIWIRPRTNATAPASHAGRRWGRAGQVHRYPSAFSALGAAGLRLNIWSIRSVTT